MIIIIRKIKTSKKMNNNYRYKNKIRIITTITANINQIMIKKDKDFRSFYTKKIIIII